MSNAANQPTPTYKPTIGGRQSDISIDQLLSHFKNSEELFNTDPVFKSAILSLLVGEDPLKILEVLMDTNRKLLKELTDLVNIFPRTIITQTNE